MKIVLKIDAARERAWLATVFCATFGHSRIVTHCFGYISCSRCSEQLGDTLGGSYGTEGNVIVGHKCQQCQRNAEALTWKDKWLAPWRQVKKELEV